MWGLCCRERSKIWKSTAGISSKWNVNWKIWELRIETSKAQKKSNLDFSLLSLFHHIFFFSHLAKRERKLSKQYVDMFISLRFHKFCFSNSFRYYCFTFCSRQNPSASTRLLCRYGKRKHDTHDTHELEIDIACWWEFKWFLFSTQRTLYIYRLSSFQCLSFWMVVVFDMFGICIIINTFQKNIIKTYFSTNCLNRKGSKAEEWVQLIIIK